MEEGQGWWWEVVFGKLGVQGWKRKCEKAHWAEDGTREGKDRGTHVSASSSTSMKMTEASELYVKIGKHTSPGIDPGAVYEGGTTFQPPPVRSLWDPLESKNTNATRMLLNIMPGRCVSCRILSLSNSSTRRYPIHSRKVPIQSFDSGYTRTMWRDEETFSSSPNYRSCHVSVKVGDGHVIIVIGIGDVTMRLWRCISQYTRLSLGPRPEIESDLRLAIGHRRLLDSIRKQSRQYQLWWRRDSSG